MPEVAYSLDANSRIAIFVIDTAGPVNTIGQRFISDLERATSKANQDRCRGVILVSAKKSSFLDGANLKEIITDATPSTIRAVVQRFQDSLAALAKSPFPVVAILNGQSALGGGLELLLWSCDRVFATASSKMGLPEVNVGLFPAGGGTQILPRVLGFKAAVDAIVNGRISSAEDFAASSFVTLCDASKLSGRAAEWIEANQGVVNRNYDPHVPDPAPLSADEKRQVIAAARARYGISLHRPYLHAALDSMEAGLSVPLDQAARADLDLFVPLFENPNTRSKIDLFFLVTSVGPRLARVDAKRAVKADRVAVIGSGLMGSGIAQVAADKGMKVTLIDVDAETAQRAITRIDQTLEDLVSRGRWTKSRKEAVMANLSCTANYGVLKDIPLVIECVFEDLPLKRKIVTMVQDVNPKAIFASNTSTIPMAEIAKEAAYPEQVVGMHYFSPVPLMPLLEVIEGPQSSPVAVATAVTVGRAMGKTVILVGDGPGFYTSRTFGAYVMNGFRLAERGLSPWDIDRLALKAGFPQGPLHVYGTAGGNVIFHAGKFMESRFPGRLIVPETLSKMFSAGFVGAGRPSFYLDDRKMIPNEAAVEQIVRIPEVPLPTVEEATDILLLGMVNEAFWCMSDGVLRDCLSMDLGAVLGIGFPDCWHGPARYTSLKGVKAVKERLVELAEKFRIPALQPAPEFDLLIACGLDSNLI
jgi:3-hydroxyacyl-CoA dehydrogenase / enoyl-CoA hydratase / 3-hydroxybutyryl-CoA epimerase